MRCCALRDVQGSFDAGQVAAKGVSDKCMTIFLADNFAPVVY